MGIVINLNEHRLANGDWIPEFPFDNLDILGISEDESEDLRTNIDNNTEDISPDAAEKEGQDE